MTEIREMSDKEHQRTILLYSILMKTYLSTFTHSIGYVYIFYRKYSKAYLCPIPFCVDYRNLM